MHRTVRSTGLLTALILTWGAVSVQATNTFVVASWNVENLFDADDDPDNAGDDEYTSAGWTRWTGARYSLKLDHLADVIAGIRPDVLCLAEVENRRVLVDLAAELAQRNWAMPVILHRDGKDTRGIDTAMLARTPPAATNWLTPHPIQRDVLIADFESAGRRLTVFGNHWKSHYGKKAEADAIRAQEARAVRAELDRRLRADPAAAIVVAGDFNDDIDSPILQAEAGFATNAVAVRNDPDGRLLLNLSGELSAAARGTYYYTQAKRWNSFDSISVTRGMLDGVTPAAPWGVQPGSYGIYATPAMCQTNGAPLPFRRVGYRDTTRIYSGYADHFPLRVTLVGR